MYEYSYNVSEKTFLVWKVEGRKVEILLKVRTQEKAERACKLYEKYGHGALRYPVRG